MRLRTILHHYYTARLALCLMLFGALAPSVSHLLAPSIAGTIWVEVCTAAGAKSVAVESGQDEQPADMASAMEHCPFCFLQNHLPFVPPTEYAHLSSITLAADAPTTFVRALVVPRFPRSAHLSRAPPVFS